LPSDGLFDALYARGPVAAQTDGHAWLVAMLDVEAALARACASERLIPATSAEAIVAACRSEAFDLLAIAAPSIDVSLFARGMLHRCVTRFYFADEEQANAADPVLATVPVARRETLLAKPTDGGYEIDIRLQGAGETVFFAV
jgi:protocatechuate 3,4-dioxygenase beta subunit